MTVQSKTETLGAARQIVRVDAHTLHADTEPPVGGATAPSPHDYFDVALATCKALTAIVYAKSKGIPLDSVTATVSRDSSNERQGTYVLTVELAFEGALDAEQKQKLHDVLTRCPIHKLMTTSTVEIRQSLATA